jgi:hypothetical protein
MRLMARSMTSRASTSLRVLGRIAGTHTFLSAHTEKLGTVDIYLVCALLLLGLVFILVLFGSKAININNAEAFGVLVSLQD